MQKLSKRLQAAADFVTDGNRAADIGTDHGFLPIYLVQSGKCPRVIAMDIREGPLERAKEHIAAAGLGDVIKTRLSDGMQALGRAEADSVVITGMGGLTVLHILEEASEMVPDLKELVLEPQSDIAKVRRYLREHNMEIDREELVQEAGKFYPILHVIPAKPMQRENDSPVQHVIPAKPIQRENDPLLHAISAKPMQRGDIQKVQPELSDEEAENRHRMDQKLCSLLGGRERVQGVLDQYGACTVYGKHPLLRQMLERDEKRELGILQALKQGLSAADGAQERADATRMRRQEVERRLEEIRALLKMIGQESKK